MELRILGPLQVVDGDRVLTVGGPRERALLVALALHAGVTISADALVDALWGNRPPRSANKLLQNHVLRLRKALGASAIETRDRGYALVVAAGDIDAGRFEILVRDARAETAGGDLDAAITRFDRALALWRGPPDSSLSNWPPAESAIARLTEMRRLAEEEAIDARLARGDASACVADLESLVAAEPLREHRWVQLMVALYRSGRQSDALRAYQRARTMLADELGIEPGPELRATEQAVIEQVPTLDHASTAPAAAPRLPTGVVTFLLTDIEDSTGLWDDAPLAMEAALTRHSAILGESVAATGGVLLKSRGEGDSTFSAFARASDAVAAAMNARAAFEAEAWPDGAELSVRFAVYTGEAVERDGDYYGTAVNRAARLRAVAAGDQILLSQATAEVVRDHLPETADLVELGAHALRGLDRPERVFAVVEPGRPGHDDSDAASPYPGLRAFQAEDHERFFGREPVVESLVTRLGSTRFIALIGASGSGKSSLVRAGLAPRLATRTPVLVMTPGPHPCAEPAVVALGEATANGTELVVIVDQFEELFRVCDAADERRAFLDELVRAITAPDARTAVVIALRADFYGACADYEDFAALVAASTMLLGPMRTAELRAAIEGPAHTAGLRLEPGLSDVVLAEVADEPGGLPLLSHALLETWRRRRGRTLTVNGYRAAGGVRGAIARTAETVYGRLTTEQQARARDIFVRLTELGDGAADTRRRVALAEIVPPENAAAVAAVVNILADARLVTVGDGTVEVAHEALIREWPRLREWLDEDRDGLRLLGHLHDATNEWIALEKDPGALYRGARLAAVLQWLDATPDAQLSAHEREFVEASETAHDAELQRERDATRRLRVLVAGLGVAFLVALAAGGLAVLQRRDANHQAARATTNATLAEAARLDTLARTLPSEQADLALLLGVESHRRSPSVATEGGLESALVRTPSHLAHILKFDTTTVFAAATADGRLLAAASPDGNIGLYDTRSGRKIRAFVGRPPQTCAPVVKAGSVCAPAATFNADGTLIASGGFRQVDVWRVDTGQLAGPPIVPGGSIVYSSFDPTDAARLYTVGNDGTVALWDLRDAAHPRSVGARFRFTITPGDNANVIASPDGRFVAAGGFGAERTDVWDAATRQRRFEVPGTLEAFSPDSATLTTAQNGRIEFWNVATGTRRGPPIAGLPAIVPRVVFAADGRTIAAGEVGVHPSVRVFDVDSRREVARLSSVHRSYAFPVAFERDGALLTNGADQAARWKLDAAGSPIETRLRVPGSVAVAQFSPGGTVITMSDDAARPVIEWDGSTGARRGDFLGGNLDVTPRIAFSPDGTRVVVGGADGTFSVWDRARSVRLSRTSTGHPGWVTVAWDSRLPFVATDTTPSEAGPNPQNSAAELWDVSDPAHPTEARVLAATVRVGYPTFSFSADGRMLALATGTGGAAAVYDVASGRPLHTEHAVYGVVQVAFSPSGKWLAIATGQANGGQVAILDTATWEQRAIRAVPYLPDGIAFVAGDSHVATTSVGTAAAQLDLLDRATLLPVGEPVPVPTPEAFLAYANGAGTKVATGTTNGIATVVDVDPGSWARTACEIAGRNLTRAEWTEYLPDRQYRATCAQWPNGS